jgi:hypothetical protein
LSGKTVGVNSSRNKNSWHQLYAGIRRIPAVWILALPLLLLLPTLGSFPFRSLTSEYSDLAISHYPNAIFLRDAIIEWRTIPLWSSTIMSGYPFAANPLSGLWYPPGWAALILPLPLGFNLLIGLHLIWGGIGLYLLMRAEGLGKTAALLAGLSFGLLPKLFAHYGAGHLTLLYAVPWTPWLLLSQRTCSERSGWFRIPPGLVLALIFLADVRWGAFSALTWWAYSAVHTQQNGWLLIKKLSLQTVLALLLAAPQLLPLIEFSSLSSRADLAPADVLANSLPVASLLGLVLPASGIDHEWVFYVGGMVSLLALGGLLLSKARRSKYFWGVLSLTTILVALGSQIPGSDLVAKLPLVSLLRVPSRALFLTGLGIASLVGYGLDAILKNSSPQRVRIFGLCLFGVIVFALVLLVGFGLMFGDVPDGMLWGTLGLMLSAVWILAGIKSWLPVRIWIGGVFLIAMLDLGAVDINSFSARNPTQVISEGEEVAMFLATQEEDFRTYSPSYSLPQQMTIHHGIRLTDGVDPLQLAKYVSFMDLASGVPRDGYSVTIPNFAGGDPKTDNAGYGPDAEKLGLLNVGYLVSEFEVNAEGIKLEQQIGDTFIYRNEKQRSPAWVLPGANSNEKDAVPIKILQRSPNHIQLSAKGPGTLVVSEISYPGWQVWVDGVAGELLLQGEILMGVELEPGSHKVDLWFRPLSVYAGLVLFLIGLIFLAWSMSRAREQENGEEFKPD